MASLNKVHLIGNLGADPELVEFDNGDRLAKFRIATSRAWTDKKTSERREETEWHSIECRNGLAGVAVDYLAKGRPVYVEGRLKTDKYTDKDGIERYATKIVCESMQLLGSRDQQGGGRQDDHDGDGGYDDQPRGNRSSGGQRQGGGQQARGNGGQRQGGGQQARGNGNASPQRQARYAAAAAPADAMDDDIPF